MWDNLCGGMGGAVGACTAGPHHKQAGGVEHNGHQLGRTEGAEVGVHLVEEEVGGTDSQQLRRPDNTPERWGACVCVCVCARVCLRAGVLVGMCL